MSRLKITAKIWLSIGIFVLGFVLFTVLEQMQGWYSEERLGVTSEVLFPAAQESQKALASFQRMKKAFEDGVVMQEPNRLASGHEYGLEVVHLLRHLATLPSLRPERLDAANRLASSMGQLVEDATRGYQAAAAGIAPDVQQQIRALGIRIEASQAPLADLNDQLAGDLHSELAALKARSARVRDLGLVLFVTTLVVSAVLVNLTVRRGITRPLTAAEAELAHERDLLRILMDHIPDFIYFKDPHGRYLRVNRALAHWHGLDDPEQMVGHTAYDFFDADAAIAFSLEEQRIISSGQPSLQSTHRVIQKETSICLTITKVPVRDEQGRVEGLVCIARDSTDWQRAMETLAASEEQFRLLFRAIPHSVWVYDRKTLAFLMVNDAAVCRYGYSAEEFLSLRIDAIHASEESARLHRAAAEGNEAGLPSGTWAHRTKTGELLDVELSSQSFNFHGCPAVLVVSQDITDRRRLEAELRQAQKLESVGQLAAGIAHEINSPIQFLGDNLRFLADAFHAQQAVFSEYGRLVQQGIEEGSVSPEIRAKLQAQAEDADLEYLRDEIPKAVAQSLDGIERVATIVRAMKEFAHPGFKEKTAADLNKALSNALIVARNAIKYVADSETDFGELPPVQCHIGEINQVFLNLLINAADAIQETRIAGDPKGLIRVTTRRVENQAVIMISDTGCGIPENIRGRVFDPFFTTKEVGHGSGQGLAIARTTVVEKHGGSIRFEPNGQRGTTFIVSLPIEPIRTVPIREETYADTLV